MKRLPIVLLLIIAIGACKQTETTTTTEGTTTATEMASTTTEGTTAPAGTATTTTTATPETVLSEGFSTPESVLYDAEQDVYYVSNINGPPLATDDNGYISRINAETLQVEARWIDGAKTEITLHAPKGMAILGDDLYVSDITSVRKFDRRSGVAKGEIAIAGSTFLNDVASDGKTVYVSDSGMKADGEGFAPTGTDAIWSITGPQMTRLASGTDLNRPNGVAVAGGKVWVVTFGSNELFAIEGGKKGVPVKLPNGSLDGLLTLDDGSIFVTSWDGKAIYRGTSDGNFTPAVENVNAPADIGFDTKRRRLLIPLFMDNRVTIRPAP